MEDCSLVQGKRVLLVDDEADVLEALEELLSMCEVFKVDNFEAGREYLQTQFFDLAVLDIMGVKGYELLEIAVKRDVTAVKLNSCCQENKIFLGLILYFRILFHTVPRLIPNIRAA